MQQEQWKKIKGFNDYYWISSLGKVKKVLPNGNVKFLKASPNKNRHNYCYVNIETVTERKNWSLHRLVAKYFIPNPENKPCVNHLDCDVSNNQISNLEWCTYKENSIYTKKMGHTIHPIGELAGNHVLKEKTVLKIIDWLNKNEMTHLEIAKKFNTNYSNVAHIFRGSRWSYLHHLIKQNELTRNKTHGKV